MTQHATYDLELPLKPWRMNFGDDDSTLIEDLLKTYRRRMVGDNTIIWERIDGESDDDDLAVGADVPNTPQPTRPSNGAAAAAVPETVMA